MKKLGKDFFLRENVVDISRELICKFLVTNFNNVITSGMIVETEAYNGVIDKASHAYNGRRTARNEIMYGEGGNTYVYLCYGIHHLFNIVTNKKDVPDAVLIRALEPLEGIDIMLKRTKKQQVDATLTKGPGNVSKAMGISKQHSGLNLLKNEIWIEEDDFVVAKNQLGISKRIGIDGAGSAAVAKPYRFYLKGNKYVSGTNK